MYEKAVNENTDDTKKTLDELDVLDFKGKRDIKEMVIII